MMSPESEGDFILRVENIEVVYGRSVQAVRGLSLAVREGQISALLGSNGAGKSTALKAISGLLGLEDGKVVSGRILFDGRDISRMQPHELVRKGLFHIMEGRRIFEDLTVEENLTAATFALVGRGLPVTPFQLVYDYFPRLYERRHRRAGYLSGGEQQMLAIGRALIARPRLILLDEPSLGLSPILVEEIFTIISRINRQTGVSMLLVEQNANVALAVAHYGYIVESGKIQIDGPTEKLIKDQDVREFYLGHSHGGREKSFREIKSYKRRKRWLS
ncbi:ABC transporter ATP-binding protein (plasmid) [Agrobacterium leguminum]|uniref:High-affinity branched-chain amino acid transport protein (ABC superfamily, ATP-binding protein) n=1 Tax=Agrobacterium deltaense NCPPB 1641 TaxID=1183425 RepID=A0A1S7U6U1_9HYPH|nr:MULTISPECIES: ABC transporter ATP-binding protein [Agrobacterium]WFS69817.1 ABC transporter ATP-binding protein [Agrobacterium leguminum]CVI62634.1 High-affinity branched-chain amino acid transport protein (ABC superfamily, ATP-binding protein) [Agrobacterium deltaense NCPPB 1641]